MNFRKDWGRVHRKAYSYFIRLIGFSKDKTSRKLFRLFQVAVYATGIILLLNITSIFSSGSSYGTFGDFFGGMLNPILTFLTFMGLLMTIVIQQKELRLTRKELKDSSLALADQARSLQYQIENAEKKEQRELTIKMLDRWTCREMREHRLLAWEYLHDSFKSMKCEFYIDLVKLRKDEPKITDHFSEVCQFFSDLNKLLKEGVLDVELVQVLFKNSVKPWFVFFKDFRYEPYTENAELTRYDQNVLSWYQDYVFTLEKWFEK